MCIKSLVKWKLFFNFFIRSKFSLGGGICYDLLNAYACFCPDRIFRPQCNTTGVPPMVSGTSVLMSTSNRNPIDKVSSSNGDKSLQSECLCRNGGLCFTSPSGGKLCQCLNGFTGSSCERSLCRFYIKNV